jgi:hypothetical protein
MMARNDRRLGRVVAAETQALHVPLQKTAFLGSVRIVTAQAVAPPERTVNGCQLRLILSCLVALEAQSLTGSSEQGRVTGSVAFVAGSAIPPPNGSVGRISIREELTAIVALHTNLTLCCRKQHVSIRYVRIVTIRAHPAREWRVDSLALGHRLFEIAMTYDADLGSLGSLRQCVVAHAAVPVGERPV